MADVFEGRVVRAALDLGPVQRVLYHGGGIERKYR